MSKYSYLIIILLLAFVVRMYRINFPLADWHSFRQADTASVTREYVKHGVDLLHPRYHDLSNIQSGTKVQGRDNIEGWRMVEFPFVNGLIASVLRIFPQFSLVLVSRLFSIFASLGTIVFIFFLAQRVFSKEVAILSSLTFAILPYSIFYSRVILPEPFMLMFSTGSIFFFLQWLVKRRNYWLLCSAVFLSLAMLLKPYVVFTGLAYLALMILYIRKLQPLSLTKVAKTIALLLLFAIISITPFLFWRLWIVQYPSGIPASDWLFNGNHIRFRPAWFRWLFWERLTKLLLGYLGIILAFSASIPFFSLLKQKHNLVKIAAHPLILLIGWWIGIMAYLIVFATGNVQHDYYQNLLLPVLAITIGMGGMELFYWLKKRLTVNLAKLIVFAIFIGMEIFSWQQVKGFFNVNHWEYAQAGQFVDQNTPPSAKVIAPANGDTVFLFQTNRTGWPIGFDIDQKISEGAEYYVSTSNDDEARELEAKYQVIEKNDAFILIELEER